LKRGKKGEKTMNEGPLILIVQNLFTGTDRLTDEQFTTISEDYHDWRVIQGGGNRRFVHTAEKRMQTLITWPLEAITDKLHTQGIGRWLTFMWQS
jgi:hypothetical protein